jgi:hypothetical protein
MFLLCVTTMWINSELNVDFLFLWYKGMDDNLEQISKKYTRLYSFILSVCPSVRMSVIRLCAIFPQLFILRSSNFGLWAKTIWEPRLGFFKCFKEIILIKVLEVLSSIAQSKKSSVEVSWLVRLLRFNLTVGIRLFMEAQQRYMVLLLH